MDKRSILKQYFGHSAFRAGQEQLIDHLLARRDVVGVMPTGGGKSICYQVPALLLEGVTLVISPLISLMKDQVMTLKHMGIPAAYINSSLSPEQRSTVYRRLRAGAYKIVYVAPERLTGEGFQAAAQCLDIPLVAVDEAHCISQWGQDFRPSYLKIPEFLRCLPRRPAVGAFTATATEAVRRDIASFLELDHPFTLVTGFDRPNLFFDVMRLRAADKPAALRALLKERGGKSGIVYCATRAGVERVCSDLTVHGLAATRYHAGLSEEERAANQDDFRYDRKTVMVATNAFGMGIDKSNVGFVIHYNMPKSLEAYYQEAGRAGRDGARADCILLFSPGDVNTARFLIQNSSDNENLTAEQRERIRAQDFRRLDAMVDYCKTRFCQRGTILDYFGQAHDSSCGNCGSCLAQFQERDITLEAQMILSCVRRAEDRLGFCVGAGLLADVLYGSDKQRLRELGLDRLTTYGLMKGESMARIMNYLDHLEGTGYLHADPAHGGLELTDKAREVLFHGARVRIPWKEAPAGVAAAKRLPEELQGGDAKLFAALKGVRGKLAQREGVPAYVIFSNATLTDMARKRPRSRAGFLEVSGVGERKAQRYAKAFLEAIETFTENEA